MALQKQSIPIPFAAGLDTKTDVKQVLPGKLVALENGIFTTKNEIRKRYGYLSLGNSVTGGGTFTQGAGIAPYQNELVSFTGNEVFSYSSSTMQWTDKGRSLSLEVSVNQIVRNTYQQTVPDCAQHPNGIQVFTWEDSRGGSRYSVCDSVTGSYLLQDALIASTAIKPKPIVIGQYIVVFFIDSSTHHLRFFAVPSNTPLSATPLTDFSTNVNVTHPNYDAAPLSARIFVAYNNSDGGGGITIRYLNSFLVVSSAVDVTGQNADVAINVFVDVALQQVWVAYYNATAVRYFIYNYSLIAVHAPATIETLASVVRIASIASNGSAILWYEVSAGATYNHLVRKVMATNTGAVGSPAVFLRSVGLAAKPFFYNGLNYITVAYDSPLQPTYFTVDNTGFIACKFTPSNGGGLPTKDILPEVTNTSTGVFLMAELQKDLLTTVSGAIYTLTGVESVSLNFLSLSTFATAQLATDLHISGGILSMYDGVSVVEHGYHVFPEPVTATTATTGGSVDDGTFQYSVCYEWTDNQGNIHRSAPSIPISVTTTGGGTSTNTLTIPTLRLTQKQTGTGRTPIRLVVYRTQADATLFNQVTSITSPLLNDLTVDSVTYADVSSDATIVGNPFLYTTGGVIENIAAPATSMICTFKNRVMVVPSENKLSFWFSKQAVPGSPVEFSDLFVKSIDRRGGDITGIAQLDGNFIIFKQNSIFYVSGDGPTANGSQDDFTEAQLINTDTGCNNANSIVLMPQGIMFDSPKGKYLLDRSLSTSYIGADVEAFNGLTVTDSALISQTNQVRFALDTGVVLTYDYFFQQWSVFTDHNSAAACVFENEFTYIQPNGLVLQENPNTFTDNGRFYRLFVQTAWFSLGGLDGFQRVYRANLLGDYLSAHQLLAQVYYNFNPNPQQQDLIDATSIVGPETYGQSTPYGADSVYGGPYPLYEWRIDFNQQKCTSIQLSFEDVQSSNFGQGCSFSSINLWVGIKGGPNRVPATRSFG